MSEWWLCMVLVSLSSWCQTTLQHVAKLMTSRRREILIDSWRSDHGQTGVNKQQRAELWTPHLLCHNRSSEHHTHSFGELPTATCSALATVAHPSTSLALCVEPKCRQTKHALPHCMHACSCSEPFGAHAMMPRCSLSAFLEAFRRSCFLGRGININDRGLYRAHPLEQSHWL